MSVKHFTSNLIMKFWNLKLWNMTYWHDNKWAITLIRTRRRVAVMADKRAHSSDNVFPKKKHKSGSQKRREQDNKLLLESAKNVKPLTSFFKSRPASATTSLTGKL